LEFKYLKNRAAKGGPPEPGGPMPWHNWHTGYSGPGRRRRR